MFKIGNREKSMGAGREQRVMGKEYDQNTVFTCMKMFKNGEKKIQTPSKKEQNEEKKKSSFESVKGKGDIL